MAEIRPRINIEYSGIATIVRFTDEKILEEMDIKALQDSIISVVEQTKRINLILDFGKVRFLSSAVLIVMKPYLSPVAGIMPTWAKTTSPVIVSVMLFTFF